MAVQPPDGYVPFSKLEIGQKKIRRLWGYLSSIFFLTGLIILLIIEYHYIFTLGVVLSMSLMIVHSRHLFFWSNQQWVAVGMHHPWADGDDIGGECGVAIYSSDDNWVILPLEGRLWKINNDEMNRTSLMLNNDDEEKIGYWNSGDVAENYSSELIEIINMALALRDAQNRSNDDEDPFESSREREYEESQLLDREWGSVEPGQFDIPIGALARKITGNSEERFSTEDE